MITQTCQNPDVSNTLPPPPPDAASPLDDAQYALIRKAASDRKTVRTAARTALASAVVTLSLGVLTVPFALIWPSWQSLLTAAVLCTVGIVELIGQRKMRQAKPSAARLLGANQLAFLAAIVIYCAVNMLTFSTDQAKTAALSPEARSQLTAMPSMQKAIDRQIDFWAPMLTYGFYSLIVIVSLCSQGGLALYYWRRRRHIESFNRVTPGWIRRLFIEMRV